MAATSCASSSLLIVTVEVLLAPLSLVVWSHPRMKTSLKNAKLRLNHLLSANNNVEGTPFLCDFILKFRTWRGAKKELDAWGGLYEGRVGSIAICLHMLLFTRRSVMLERWKPLSYRFTRQLINHRRSGNFRCKNIFVVSANHENKKHE